MMTEISYDNLVACRRARFGRPSSLDTESELALYDRLTAFETLLAVAATGEDIAGRARVLLAAGPAILTT